MQAKSPDVAILIPCRNEQITIGKVIDDFRRELPDAHIVVVDNCSTDDTAKIAAGRGATVIRESRQGKGFAVDRMLDSIDADVYVMVDGDDTYPAEGVHKLIEPILADRADMTVAVRLNQYTKRAFRPLHVLGNNLIRRLVNRVAGAQLTDILSGYRAMSPRLVMRLPIISAGFEVETELTIQALYHRLKIVEVKLPYKERPLGSQSKLRTFHDGFRVLWKIFTLFRSYRPLTFFGGAGLVFFVLGVLAGIAPIRDYLTTPDHYVSHVPLAIMAMGFMLLFAGFVFMGVLLHAINYRFLELHNVVTRRRAYETAILTGRIESVHISERQAS
ncbi:MAG: glycosyltransferase [Planctomycetes bacterium]|nr:glycosyltransferase [Planctomycetota bacterium]